MLLRNWDNVSRLLPAGFDSLIYSHCLRGLIKMEVCLDFKTSISVLPHINLLLDLLCLFLNRPMPFAFEKETGKSLKPIRRGIRDCFCGEAAPMSWESYARQNPRALISGAPERACIFAMLKSGNSRSSPSWPWLYNQPIAFAIWSSLLFLPSNLGPKIIPAIGLGWKQSFSFLALKFSFN